MTSVNKAVQCYRNKQYAKCTEILRRKMSEVDIRDDDSFTIRSLILENNIIVSEFLECTSFKNVDIVKELNKFYNIHKKCSAVQNLGKLYPLQFYVTYNLLWLKWIDLDKKIFYSFLSQNQLDEIITNCLKIALRDLDFSFVGKDILDSNEEKIFLMKQLGYQLLQIPSSEVVLVLEWCIITVLVAVKSNSEINNLVEYIKLFSFFKSSWQLICSKIEESKHTKASVYSTIFKFELCNFNSDEVTTILLQVISITSAVCYLKLGDMDKSFKCLEISDHCCKFPFLFNYTKAYILKQLKQYELSLLYLFSARNIPQKGSVDSHCIYLHSCILKEQKKYVEALDELSQINTSDPLGSLAICKVCEICDEIKSISFYSSNASAENTVKLQSAVNDLHLKSLEMFANIFSKSKASCLSQNFEHNVVYYLQQHTNKSVMDILCMLARRLAHEKEYDKSSYYYLKILSLIENVPQMMVDQTASVNRLTITTLRTVFHEAASVLIYSDQIENAEIICMVPVTYLLINKSEIHANNENCFYHLDIDILALMLLAEIYRRKGLEQQRHKLLNRSLKHLLNYLLSKKSANQSSTEGFVNSELKPDLIEALVSRIYLFKALLCLEMKHKMDAAINFSRAQQFNPGDECVVYYKKFFTEITIFGSLQNLQDNIIPQGVKSDSLAVNLILELNTELLSIEVDS